MSEISSEQIKNLADAVAAQTEIVASQTATIGCLADAVLSFNASVGSLVRNGDRVLLQLQAATNAMEQNDMRQHEVRHELKTISEKIAVTSDNVKDVQNDSRQFRLLPQSALKGDSGKHSAVGMLNAFGALPKGTQILLAILVIALAASGWLAKLL